MIQTPSRRGVSQLPLPQPGVRHVERINARALPSHIASERSRSHISKTAKPARAKVKHHQEKAPEALAPDRVLPSPPIPAKGISWILLALGIVGSVHVMIMLGIEFNRTLEMRQEIARLSKDVTGLEAEVHELEAIIQYGNDPTYREQLARQQGFAFPNEIRFISE